MGQQGRCQISFHSAGKPPTASVGNQPKQPGSSASASGTPLTACSVCPCMGRAMPCVGPGWPVLPLPWQAPPPHRMVRPSPLPSCPIKPSSCQAPHPNRPLPGCLPQPTNRPLPGTPTHQRARCGKLPDFFSLSHCRVPAAADRSSVSQAPWAMDEGRAATDPGRRNRVPADGELSMWSDTCNDVSLACACLRARHPSIYVFLISRGCPAPAPACHAHRIHTPSSAGFQLPRACRLLARRYEPFLLLKVSYPISHLGHGYTTTICVPPTHC